MEMFRNWLLKVLQIKEVLKCMCMFFFIIAQQIFLQHFFQAEMYEANLDSQTFHLAPSPEQNGNLPNISVYNQMSIELITFPSASVIVIVYTNKQMLASQHAFLR